MKTLQWICELIIDMLAIMAVFMVAGQVFSVWVSWLVGFLFVILLNAARRFYRRHSTPYDVELPGKFSFSVKSTMGFQINDREFILHGGERVEVTVPKSCKAVAMKFVEAEPGDDILDAKFIAGEM